VKTSPPLQRSVQWTVPDFESVIAEVAAFLVPVLQGLARDESFNATWAPGGPWR